MLGDLDFSVAVVVFTTPERELRRMDVATGPCVPTGGRRRPLAGPTRQDHGETPRHTAALLTGQPAAGRFIDAMADASEELSRLAAEDEARGTRL